MNTLLEAPRVMAGSWTLRRANVEDESGLLKMYRDFSPRGAACGLPPREDPEPWLVALRGCPAFLVETEGQVVGHGILCLSGDGAELALFVHQDWRRRGIAGELLTALVAEARALGLSDVWGAAERWNATMRRLASSFGFVETEPEKLTLHLLTREAAGHDSSRQACSGSCSCHALRPRPPVRW